METLAAPQAEAGAAEPQFTLLLVDDEPNILTALRRLFRPQGYRVLTASAAQEGLEILAREPVDLVISDMRMPHMSGSQFLAQVHSAWPDVVRILLTGYADMASTIGAINDGQIHRYISKPWEDTDVQLAVQQALERRWLEQERRRLEALTARQNEQLRDLNADLESTVKERTAALRRTLHSLETAHDKLKQGFLTTVQVFAHLMELRAGIGAGHSRRVADHAHKLAVRVGLAPAEAQDVFLAALVHDLGKLALPDGILNKPVALLSREERREMESHPAKGEAALLPLEQMRGAARLIRAHHERYDGLGYPDGVSGPDIPVGARILAVANDYDGLLHGTLTGKRASRNEALAIILESKGKRYDPQIADAFAGLLADSDVSGQFKDVALPLEQLREGMVLSRDLYTRDGLLLIGRERVLDAHLIQQLGKFQEADGEPLKLYIKLRSEGTS